LLKGIGNTPLVELPFARDLAGGTRLFAKLESVNPGGSLKDRPVRRMVRAAVEAGALRPGDPNGRRLLDSSSGNAGIAYAMIGAALGIPVTLVVPGNASRERLDRIRAHGAELVLTDPIEGYDFALLEARRLAIEKPERYWHCDQYGNDENWRAHYEETGVEILEQVRRETGGVPDAFVAGIGTGGSLTGVGRRLRETNRDLLIAAAIPDVFPGIEGLKPLGRPDDIVPAILDETLIDHRVDVRIEEALVQCRRLAGVGLYVGPSSGAYVHVALELAKTNTYPVIVTLLCDTGERYGSTRMWDPSA
jgi:cysteine synthase B